MRSFWKILFFLSIASFSYSERVHVVNDPNDTSGTSNRDTLNFKAFHATLMQMKQLRSDDKAKNSAEASAKYLELLSQLQTEINSLVQTSTKQEAEDLRDLEIYYMRHSNCAAPLIKDSAAQKYGANLYDDPGQANRIISKYQVGDNSTGEQNIIARLVDDILSKFGNSIASRCRPGKPGS